MPKKTQKEKAKAFMKPRVKSAETYVEQRMHMKKYRTQKAADSAWDRLFNKYMRTVCETTPRCPVPKKTNFAKLYKEML